MLVLHWEQEQIFILFLRLLYSRTATPFVGYSHLYSFNDPAGMCPVCHGIGKVIAPNIDKIIGMAKSLNDGAVLFPTYAKGTWYYNSFAEIGLFDKELPLNQYPADLLEKLLYGHGEKITVKHKNGNYTTEYEGILYRFKRTFIDRDLSGHSEATQDRMVEYTTIHTCEACNGKRLNDKSLSSTIKGKNIDDAVHMELKDLLQFVQEINQPEVKPIVEEMVIRLQNLVDMNLDYLTLSRETTKLSGGEMH